MFRGGKVQSHGLNTDQDSEQGKEEKSEATERECVTFSNLLLGLCFSRGKKLLSAIFVRRRFFLFFFFFSNFLAPVLIRVQSVFHLWQKHIPRSDLPGLPNEPRDLLQRFHPQTAEIHDAAKVVALDRERPARKRQAGLRIQRQLDVHCGLAVDLLNDLVAHDDEVTLEPFIIFRDHTIQRLGAGASITVVAEVARLRI